MHPYRTLLFAFALSALVPCLAADEKSAAPAAPSGAVPAVALPGSHLLDLTAYTTGAIPESITAETVLAHIKYLASEELAGRGNGEPGLELAAEYIEKKFREYGLAPAGVNGTYFQPFEITVGAAPGPKNALSIKSGAADAITLEPAKEFEPFSFSPTTTVEAGLVFVGYGITAKDPKTKLDYDDYAGIDVKGKVVLVWRFEPQEKDAKSLFGGDKTTPHAFFQTKVDNALKHGAAAVIFITPTLNHEKDDEDLAVARQMGFSAGKPVCVIARRAFAEKLFAAAGKDMLAIQKEIDGDLKPRSFEFKDVKVRVVADVTRIKKTIRNVIGRLDGTDAKLKGQVLAIGGHYDHLGKTTTMAMSKDFVGKAHYGADDNASGTAGVLELARVFGQQKEKLGRSVLFFAFSGEELGLFGSRHWVNNPTAPLADVAAMINLDMIGRFQKDTLHIIGTGSSPTFKSDLEAMAKGEKYKVAASVGRGFGGSDHMSFESKGIPVMFFYTGQHPDYHKPTDTSDKVNAAGEATILRLVHKAAWQLNLQAERPKFQKPTVAPDPHAGLVPKNPLKVVFGAALDAASKDKGAKLREVLPGSPADKAGLQGGDVVVSLDGKAVDNVEGFFKLLEPRNPGEKTEVGYLRGKDALKATLTFDAPKATGGGFKVMMGTVPDYAFEGKGVRLDDVRANTPAAKAGLKAGDIILRVGTRNIGGLEDFTELLRVHNPGDTVEVEYQRGKDTLKSKLTFEPPPARPS